MKKSALMMAIGKEPAAEDDAELEDSAPEDDEDEDSDSEYEAFETAMDDTLDIETRFAAFQSAVRACARKSYD